MQKCCDVIVVGAGISGMSLAHYAARSGLRALVLERTARPGGCLSTRHVNGGFWYELGAHTCYATYGRLIGIIEQAGLLGSLIKRRKVPFKLYSEGKLRSIASEINPLELLLSAPRMFTARKEGLSVQQYYSRVLGRGNYGRAVGPAMSGVLSQEAGEFPAEMLFKKRPRRKGLPRSFTLSGGLSVITDAIAAGPGVEFMGGREVIAVSYSNGLYRLRTREGDVFECMSLAIATPPLVASRLLSEVEPRLASLLGGIEAGSVDTLGVAFERKAVGLAPLAGMVARGEAFYSAVSRDTVPHATLRGFSFHFRPGAMQREAMLAQVREVLGVPGAEPVDVASHTSPVPGLRVGHAELVRKMDRQLAGRRLLLVGNYFGGMSIEDCVQRSEAEWVRLKGLIGNGARGTS